MDEIELMTQEEIDAFMKRMGEAMRKMERREKRNRWLRTYGLAILAGVLMAQVLILGHIAGAW